MILLTFSLMTVTVASATFMCTDGQSSLLDEVIRLSMALFRVSIPVDRRDNCKSPKAIYYFQMWVRTDLFFNSTGRHFIPCICLKEMLAFTERRVMRSSRDLVCDVLSNWTIVLLSLQRFLRCKCRNRTQENATPF